MAPTSVGAFSLGLIRRAFEKRDVQFSPSFSVMLAAMSHGALATAGVPVTPTTALRMTAVRACVRVISEDLASLPLITYRRLSRGKERATDYPLYKLLHDAPNPEMTSYMLRETMTAHALLWGNAFAEIVWKNGRPAELWPIIPSRVSARRRTDNSELEYYVNPEGAQAVRLSRRQMFHLPGLSMSGVWGLSPIDDARDAIGLGMAGEAFASGFFSNGARPSMFLEHPGTLSPDAYERLKVSIAERHTGLSNAQRTSILEEGMTAKALSVSPEDAQFIEQRKFSVEEIARLYRVHPHKIGVMEGTQTYASVEQANIDHVVSTIRPWAVRWEQQIAAQLIPADDGEFFTEFLTTALLRGDNAARADFYTKMWQLGAMSQNDIREAENMNPIEGGDRFYVPLNFQPSDAPRPIAPPAPPVRSNGHSKEPHYAFAN